MLGERIYELRKRCGINRVELGRALGVSKQCISNWENDDILPSVEALIKISGFFSVSTDYLLELDNRRYIEASGLTPAQLRHVRQIIDDIRNKA